jgi:hypothetical protein
MAYDPNKAATFNQLRQQGLSEDAALAQAGITDADIGNYALGTNGQMGALVIGTGPRSDVEVIKQVDYPEKADAPVGSKTPINYTTTSTETVSGGGSTTTIAGARTSTAESQVYAAEASAKQAEINQFYKDNPSNFVRKRQGLPLLTPEEEAARNAQAAELRNQKTALDLQQQAAEDPGTPSVIRVPNTTTTTQTVTSGTTAINTPVQAPAGDDPAINQQTEIQLGTTPNPIRATATSPLPADGDEALAATQAAQEVIDLRIASESANPVSPLDTGYVSDAEQIAQANADAAFNARLDRAAEVDLANSGDAGFEAAARAREAADLQIAAESATPLPVDNTNGVADLFTPPPTTSPAPVSLSALNEAEFGTPNVVQNQDDVNANAAVTRGLINNAQNQSTLQTRQNTPAAADWRVRLRLAPNANYLYKVPAGNGGPGILAPLAATDGVVFPYTPAIETSYQAKYANYDLTHSNYRGYFYQNSSVENITIKGTFTAQDTREAAYLLAVIHFFKSVTKMFYGQDAEAGTPPPLVYLSGFGKYQFNESPCVVTTFGYSLPTDVDYIRANGFNNIGLNMENRRNQSSGPAIGGSLGTVVAILDRLNNAGLSNGSLTNRPSPSQVNQNVTNQTSINSTYVPTKMEISITLLPMQTRNQVSKQFSLKSFANGSLLAGGGFW